MFIIQVIDLKARILDVAKEEPYWGEKIPLRWLRFEEAKGTVEGNPLRTIEQVCYVKYYI